MQTLHAENSELLVARLPLSQSVRGFAWLVLVGVAYALLSLLTPSFPSPFGPAAPIALAAGVALAAAATWGWSTLPALALGAWGAQAFGMNRSALTTVVVVLVHASVGASLMGRSSRRRELVLDTTADILRHLLLPACVAGAGGAVAVAALTAAQGNAGYVAAARFGSDVFGMLTMAPIVLALIGLPRSSWAPRRLTLALPMAVATALLLAAFAMIARWDMQRVQDAFEREAQAVDAKVEAQLTRSLDAIDAMHGAMAVTGGNLSRRAFDTVANAWLDRTPVALAIGWNQRVPRDQAALFEQRVRQEGEVGYRIYNRDGGVSAAVLAKDRDMFVMRHLARQRVEEPRRSAALGINVLSIPEARETALRALAGDVAVASPVFRLTQQDSEGVRLVVYRPLRLADGSVAGLLYAAVFLDRLLEPVLAQIPRRLQVCIVDSDVNAKQRRLTASPGCESQAPTSEDLRYRTQIEFAGRHWELDVAQPMTDAVRAGGFWNVWLFALPGSVGAAVLGALFLVNTGRVRRVETEVERRAAELQREVAERKLAEQEVQASESERLGIFNTVTVGLVRIQIGGVIRNANPAYCELTGYTLDELRGMHIDDITPEPDRKLDEEVVKMIVRGHPDVVHFDKHYRTKRGEIVPISATVRVVRDAEGKPLYTVGAVQDLRHSLRLREAERVRDQAQTANRAKSEFVARMSHELRTPLNAILGFAQLLESRVGAGLSPAHHKWLEQIQKAGWHLLAMINDVLDLSRVEADTLKLNLQRIDLQEIVGASMAMVQDGASRRGITLSSELGTGATAVIGDPVRVQQVLVNLLSNAVKYNRDEGRIDVRSRPLAGSLVEIEVVDTGLGMDEAQLAALFQPFNRLGRERSGIEGTGIGLTIAKRLAEMMGGALRAHGVQGQGSVFALVLPGSVDAGAEAAPASAAPPAAAADYPACQVLYIEDDATNVELMRGMLGHRPQIAFAVARTGLEGIELATSQHPRLILLDVDLPDVDGLEVLRRLKSDARVSHVPVIVVSSHAMGHVVQAALARGAADFLPKPLDLAALLVAIDVQLASAPSPPEHADSLH